MSIGVRKFVLTVHLIASLGWLGAVVAYVALGISAVRSVDPQLVRSAWNAMELVGWTVLVPLAIGSLATGVLISLATPWGLFRHYWVLAKLAINVLATVVLLLYMVTSNCD